MKCKNCNSMIADDSVFCPYCGRKIERISPFDVSFTEARRAKMKAKVNKASKVIAFVLVALLAVGLIGGIIDDIRDDIADSALTPIAEPKSGEILSREEVADYFIDDYGDMWENSEITVTASVSESCVVKLKTRSGNTYISFYVRSGDTVTVDVPLDEYYVYFASGKTWYGEDQLFGENTSYSKDSTITDFSEGTWEYTLNSVSGGNFSPTYIDEDEF